MLKRTSLSGGSSGQPADDDLTAIAALDSSTAGALVTDGSGWIRKTYAQLKDALGLTKSDVGLGNVDNTADTAKPVSTAQQTALDLKAPLASPAFTGTPTGITKTHVGLGNVANTAQVTAVTAADGTITIGGTSTAPTVAVGTGLAQSKVTNLTTDLAAKATVLTVTAVKTSAYSAAANEFVPVNTTSGSVTVTFPTAPADGTRVGVKHVVRGSTNTVGLALGGSDVFNVTGGATTGTITLLNQATIFQYKSSGAIWYATEDDTPLSQLDLRFQGLATDLTAIAALTPSNDDVLQRKSGVWTPRTPGQLKIDLGITPQDIGAVDRYPLVSGETTWPRQLITAGNAMTSGAVYFNYFTARKTETITSIVTYASTAAAATPTLSRIGVYSVAGDGALTLIASSASDTALWTTANVARTATLSSSWSKVAGTVYAIGFLATSATTMPNLFSPGLAINAAILNNILKAAPKLTDVLTSQTDLPSSVAANGFGATAPRLIYAELVP